jgi:hypothetical protein
MLHTLLLLLLLLLQVCSHAPNLSLCTVSPTPPHTLTHTHTRTPTAVRFGAWVKRTFSLKPALERIREGRRDVRNPELQSQQVERMR